MSNPGPKLVPNSIAIVRDRDLQPYSVVSGPQIKIANLVE